MLGVAVVSLVFHAGVLAAVGELGVAGVGLELSHARALEAATVAAARKRPRPSCAADVYLAATARAALCVSPFGGADARACAAAFSHEVELGVLSCQRMVLSPTETSTALAVLTPEQLEEIEAEPLLEALTKEEQQKFEAKQQEELAAKAEEVKQQEATRSPRAQVVEVARPEVEIDPDQARFVSDYASKVDKQTVARGSRFEEMVARPSPAALAPTTKPVETPSATQPKEPMPPGANQAAPTNPGPLAMRTPGPREREPDPLFNRKAGQLDGTRDAVMAGGVIPRRGDGSLRTASRDLPSELEPGKGGAGGGAPPIPDLTPSRQNLERAIGGGSVDHLDDVANGEFTALNSKRWKHATFFNRLKRQVAQNWEPAAVYLRRDPTGSIYGIKSRTTSVRVSLTTDGTMQEIVVVGASGIDFLDDEAVRAFRAAGPFPNPPRELANREDRITFDFSFHFEIGSRSSWKIYRSR